MDFGIYAGDTDKTIYLRLRDSTTGLAKTGLVYNSAGAVCSYTLPLAARAAITLATQTVTGAHSDGGFVEVDATNCKGLYRLDLPDAAIASGNFTVISIEFDGIIEESIEIPLHTRKVNVTQFGGTAGTFASGRPEVNTTHAAGTAWNSGAIGASTLASNTITAAKIATDAIGASQIAADAIGSSELAASAVSEIGTEVQSQLVALGLDMLVVDGGLVNSATSGTIVFNVAGTYANGDLDGTLIYISSGTANGLKNVLTATTFSGGVCTANVKKTWNTTPVASDVVEVYGFSNFAAIDDDLTTVASNVTSILADTNELQTDWADGGRLDLILDSVLAKFTTTRAEPGQGAPAATTDPLTKLDYLYKAWRNKKTQTSTTFSLYADDTTTVDQKATVSDDNTTATVGEIASGP